MDPNRSPLESCANFSDDAHIAYQDYHNFIEKNFKSDFMLTESRQFSQGLIIDLHGHSHIENWIELGYCLTRHDLNKKTLCEHHNRSSIDSLIAKSSIGMEKVIRGEQLSLGGLLENKFNLKVVPSPRHPHPLNNNYYCGGYITEIHGSMGNANYPFNAIQIEVPASLRTDESVDNFAKNLATSLFEFYFAHSFDS